MANSVYKSKYSGEEIDAILDFVKTNLSSPIKKPISVSDWSNGVIQIPFKEHNIKSPQVALFMSNEGTYEMVFGAITINSNNDIIIKSDLPFDGEIIIN